LVVNNGWASEAPRRAPELTGAYMIIEKCFTVKLVARMADWQSALQSARNLPVHVIRLLRRLGPGKLRRLRERSFAERRSHFPL
jgi:hypothetical protein